MSGGRAEKLSFLDIMECRDDHAHATEIDINLLYRDAVEFILTIAASAKAIMDSEFNLCRDDLEFLETARLTDEERIIGIIDSNEETGRILKKAIFDRMKGNAGRKAIRGLGPAENPAFLSAHDLILSSQNLETCNRLYLPAP